MFLQAAITMTDLGTSRPMTGTKHWEVLIRLCGFPQAWEVFPKRDSWFNNLYRATVNV